MTTQTGKDAGNGGGSGKDADAPDVSTDDLDLIDDKLEDEGKTDAELWAEADAAEGETAAGEEGDKDSDKAAGTDTDAGKTADGDESAADDEDDEPDKPAADAADKAGDKSKADAKSGDKGGEKEPTLEELKAERARLIEENKRLEQADRSNRGRVSALQQKLDGRRGVGQPTKPAKKEPFADDKGKAFKQEYPEVAEPVARELQEVRSELDDLKADRARREQEAESARLQSNEKVLDTKHPKWQETAATPEFEGWLTKVAPMVKAAVQRNFNAIVDADDAVDIFDRFEAFRSSQAGGDKNTQRQGARQGAQDGPAGGKTADGKNGSSLSGKRQRQLESSSGTKSSGHGLADGIPEEGDAEAIWKAFDREEARQERQARRA